MNETLSSGTSWKRNRKHWKTCLFLAVLTVLFNATATHGQTVTNVSDFGFDPADSTTYLQAAIDSGADTVIVDNVGSNWYSRPLFLRSDLELVIDSGVELQAKPGGFPSTSDRFLTATTCSNLVIRGPGSLKMQKSEYTSGEWRHAINLISCDTVTVTNLAISDTGGDGIYIGDSSGPCKNIVIDDCVVDSARRNGISVISVENLRVSNCTLKNTYGTSPMAGIDFEPNSSDQPLKNCLVENCSMLNNYYRGFLVAAGHGDGTTPPYDITATNCTMSGGAYGIMLKKSTAAAKIVNPSTGLIKFIDCTVQNTRASGVELTYFYNAGLSAVFENCQINNSGTTDSTKSPIQFALSANVTCPVGGITFTNTTVTDSDAPGLMKLSIPGQSDVENLNGAITYNGEVIQMDAYANYLSEGLIGHWTFDAVTNGNTVIDSAYDGYDGTMAGAGFDSGALMAGRNGNALAFDGTDDVVGVSDATAPELDKAFTAFTAMAWIKPNHAGGGTVMGKMGGSGNYGWELGSDQAAGSITFTYRDGSSGTEDTVTASGLSIPTNEWMHIAVTFEAGDTVAIYTNGLLAASETNGVLSQLNGANAVDLQIGNRGDSLGGFWDGGIDDAKIFNTALPSSSLVLPNAIPYEESFESYTNGFSMVGTTIGWTADAATNALVSTNAALVSSLVAYSEPCGYPVAAATHEKVLEVGATATDKFEMDAGSVVWVDKMIQPVFGGLTTDAIVLAGAQGGYTFFEGGHPAIRHHDLAGGTNRWTVLDNITIAEGDWVRLTFKLDYQTDDPTNNVCYFQVRLDGVLATNAAAWSINNGTGSLGGSWFAMSSKPDRLNYLLLERTAMDDLVVTTNNPLARDVVIVSDNGHADPAVGTYAYTYGDSLSLSVTNSPFSQGTNQFVCTGWNMSGHAPASGSGTNVAITLTNDLTLAWLWSTNNSLAPMGTPEWWLTLHGLTNGTFAEEELLDGDNDSSLAWMEWVADTIPSDSNSVLKITDIQTAVPGMQVYWQGGVQATQYLEWRTNLVSGTGWAPVFTNDPPTSVTNSFADPSATTPSGFYRLKVLR